MEKLTKEIQEQRINLWIEGLESGKYKQGVGYLCSDDAYCCIGVGYMVAIENGLDIRIKTVKRCDRTLKKFDGEQDYANKKLMEYYGLEGISGYYGSSSLVEDNDKGVEFPEIAQIMREHKSELFNLV